MCVSERVILQVYPYIHENLTWRFHVSGEMGGEWVMHCGVHGATQLEGPG